MNRIEEMAKGTSVIVITIIAGIPSGRTAKGKVNPFGLKQNE